MALADERRDRVTVEMTVTYREPEIARHERNMHSHTPLHPAML
jgi:hypothetical protein